MQRTSRTPNKPSKDGPKSQKKPTPVKDTKEQNDSLTLLPLTRIRTIMKSAPDSDMIAQEALVLVCKAAEMFVQDVTKRAIKKSKKPTDLEYEDMAEVVANDEKLEFLASIIPKKITVRKYREMLEEESSSSDASGEDSDSSSSSEEESSSGSGEEEENEADEVVSISSSTNDGEPQMVGS